ncbi:hypothetical protein JOD65_000289 [Nocardioides cavernae]|nr:hypothetical protein [Nocardioides cavernae]
MLAKGLLVQVERGAPGGPKTGRRRAHVWALPDNEEHPTAVGRQPHASNTVDRYVAPRRQTDATPCGAPCSDSGSRPADRRDDLPTPAVEQLLYALIRALRPEAPRETVVLSWPSDPAGERSAGL